MATNAATARILAAVALAGPGPGRGVRWRPRSTGLKPCVVWKAGHSPSSEVNVTNQDCIFCKIGRGDVPAEKLFDDDEVFAISDIHPKAPVHILVIPHRHVVALTAEQAEGVSAAVRCFSVAPQIASEAGVGQGGYRLIVNQGSHAGQEVPHFHLHILGGRQLGPMG